MGLLHGVCWQDVVQAPERVGQSLGAVRGRRVPQKRADAVFLCRVGVRPKLLHLGLQILQACGHPVNGFGSVLFDERRLLLAAPTLYQEQCAGSQVRSRATG